MQKESTGAIIQNMEQMTVINQSEMEEINRNLNNIAIAVNSNSQSSSSHTLILNEKSETRSNETKEHTTNEIGTLIPCTLR